jgi:bifunctional ADP-heptose synthase (sugar kinase/adenylyltransferase)
VIATIMTSLAGGADIFEAATLANCAAGIVIAEVGAVPVDLQKLRDACARIG